MSGWDSTLSTCSSIETGQKWPYKDIESKSGKMKVWNGMETRK